MLSVSSVALLPFPLSLRLQMLPSERIEDVVNCVFGDGEARAHTQA